MRARARSSLTRSKKLDPWLGEIASEYCHAEGMVIQIGGPETRPLGPGFVILDVNYGVAKTYV